MEIVDIRTNDPSSIYPFIGEIKGVDHRILVKKLN